jgi:D-alanyl-D-alanine carboxypeptidase (penicillin-binding protein 5/6)
MPELVYHQRQKRPKRRLGRWLLAILTILIVGALTANYLRPLPVVAAVTHPLPAITAQPVTIAWPATGQAAIGAPDYGLLASHNDTVPASTASIAKLITALCVLQKYPLAADEQGPNITLNDADVDLYNEYVAKDGSVAAVQAGEQLSEYQMLQGMLLPSANNLADSLAIWAFGSVAAYQSYATQFLAENNLSQIHIGSDASGYNPDTTATASDLVQLANLLVQQPAIMDIASQPSATLPVAGTVYNYNFMLGNSGINGLKTGNNDADLGAFLFSASIPVGDTSLTVVGAIMNQPDLPTALRAAAPLVASLRAGFEQRTIVRADQTLATYTAPWGAGTKAVADKTSEAILWKGNAGQTTYTASSITAGQKDSTVGSLTFDAEGIRAATPVVLKKPLPGPSFWWRLTRH